MNRPVPKWPLFCKFVQKLFQIHKLRLRHSGICNSQFDTHCYAYSNEPVAFVHMVHNLAFNFSWWSNQVTPLWLLTSFSQPKMVWKSEKSFFMKMRINCSYGISVSNPVTSSHLQKFETWPSHWVWNWYAVAAFNFREQFEVREVIFESCLP